MSDHIQPEPTSLPKCTPEMEIEHDPTVDSLRQLVQRLDRERRRWKVIGIVSLVVLLLTILSGGLGVSSAILYVVQIKNTQAVQARLAAEAAQQQAQEQALRAQQALEEAQRARQEAERRREKGLN
jgi:hypothetical protein